jgi:cell division septation protein DedD
MVQVASLRDRSEADAIVKRLAGKGYPAFVLEPPAGGAAPIFRVRIGGYPTRAEAQEVGRRLEKEEQFQPWITR